MKRNMQRYAKAFYSKEAILTAIRDYRSISAIRLTEETDCYVCAFSRCVVDAERVINEFDNYLIEQMNSQGENNPHDLA